MSNFKPHPIGRFPYWADAEAAAEKETVGDKKKTVVPIPIPPYYYYSDEIEAIEDHSSTDPVSPDALDNSDANFFPWEQWSQLPKVEREAEMKEAQKEAVINAANEGYAPWTDAKSATERKLLTITAGRILWIQMLLSQISAKPVNPSAKNQEWTACGNQIL